MGLDCANGSSSAIAKSVFDALRAKTYVINNNPDGTNINTNCGSTHIEVLKQFVVDNGLDVGFAYDGDADRCIACLLYTSIGFEAIEYTQSDAGKEFTYEVREVLP